MLRFPALAFALIALCALAVACGGGSSGTKNANVTPVAGNSELVIGPNRFQLGLIDDKNERILPAAGVGLRMEFFRPDKTSSGQRDARFIWAIPDVTGFWAADVDFDTAGVWSAQLTVSRPDTKDAVVKVNFQVADRVAAPKIGDTAPATDNLTLSGNTNVKRVTTDPQPNLDYYKMTVTQALAAKQPFVVIFATPLFCTSQFCGPLLNNLKQVTPEFAGRINVIHIEPYDLTDDGQLVTDYTGAPVAAPPTDAWKLQTEPWVFVVGADGKITQRFEASASTDELRTALQQVSGS